MSSRRTDGRHRGSGPEKPKRPTSGGWSGTVRIESLAPGGRGLVRLESGRVVFVPGVAPGDMVELRTHDDRGSGAELLRVVEPSPSRVVPPCPRASTCGGCDWIHIAPPLQPPLHATAVAELIDHAVGAGASSCAVRSIVHAPADLGYRTRARLHIEGKRGRLSFGYLATGSHLIVEAPDCAVLDSRLEKALILVRSFFRGLEGTGEVALALGKNGLPVIDAALEGDLSGAAFGEIDGAVGKDIAGARVAFSGATKPSSFGDPRPVQRGADGFDVVIAAGGFAQPSDEGASALASLVAASTGEGKQVIELFAGSGTLSIALARSASSFTSVEIDGPAVAASRENLAARGLEGKLVTADADTFALPKRADVVVLDPPRAGARGATANIVTARTKRVVYVSCEPSTLARDARVLAEGGYRLSELHTVELFPQTSHVEVVAVFDFDKEARMASSKAARGAS